MADDPLVARTARSVCEVQGYISEVRVHPTLEVWLRTEPVAVSRAHDGATGLDLLDLPEHL
jgi:hypothetical protein